MTLRHVPRHLQGLPTLTEVIDLPASDGAGRPAAQAAVASEPAEPPVVSAAPAVPMEDEEAELLSRVQVDVQRQVEQMLEQRVREVIVPVLARSGETLVRELRAELAVMLDQAVARSVSRELARRGDR